jgi:ATPase
VHATDPVDAVQRFIGRIELGIIPHIIDTIIYIRGGSVFKVYYLTLVVRTPTGMTEADLARPVVEVRDFENSVLEYEIYTYGEENVIIPIQEKRKSPVERLARKYILQEIRKFDRKAEVEILSDNKIAIRVDNEIIPRLIGTKGKNVKELEEKLGVSIDISPKIATFGKEVQYSTNETGAYIVFQFNEKLTGKFANFYIDNEYLFSATIGKDGLLRVSKDSDIGKEAMTALVKNNLKVFV